jgi:hypothetical protein
MPHPPPARRCHSCGDGMLRDERFGRSTGHRASQIGLPA